MSHLSLRAAAGGEAISYEAIWGLLRAKNAPRNDKDLALPRNIENWSLANFQNAHILG